VPEMVALSKEDLVRVLKYAFAHCECKCPAERDPETCVVLAELSKLLGLKLPCQDEFGDFTEESFTELIREIERRRGKSIDEFLSEVREAGPKCLQDQIDEMDATFALEVLRAMRRRKR